MKHHQFICALAFIAAMQMSVSAQRVFGEVDGTGATGYQARVVEAAKIIPTDPPPAEGAGDVEIKSAPLPAPVPTPLQRGFQNRRQADSYMDVYKILKEDNPCSRFFGGAPHATEVLNRFTEQFKKKRFDNPGLAVEMSGAVTHVSDHKTGASYRLFEKVMVNTNGPLSAPPPLTHEPRHFIGRFASDTRAARALILLHEIGHLVRGSEGQWLLRNDGNNAELSRKNTEMVEDICLKQLRALKN